MKTKGRRDPFKHSPKIGSNICNHRILYPVPVFLAHLRADTAEAEEENSNDAVALVTAATATLFDATFSLCHRQQCPLRLVLHAKLEDTYQRISAIWRGAGSLHTNCFQVAQSSSSGVFVTDAGVFLFHLPKSSGIVRIGSQVGGEINGCSVGDGAWGWCSQDKGGGESSGGEELGETHVEDGGRRKKFWRKRINKMKMMGVFVELSCLLISENPFLKEFVVLYIHFKVCHREDFYLSIS